LNITVLNLMGITFKEINKQRHSLIIKIDIYQYGIITLFV